MNKWWLIIVLLVATAGLIMWPRGKRQAEVVEKSPYHTPREIKPHVPLKPPIFYLGFEGTNSPAGSIKIEKIEEKNSSGGPVYGGMTYTDGIKGRALVVGKEETDYVFSEPQPPRPQGTICLWIRPMDWDDESYLTFLKIYKCVDKKRILMFRIYRVHSGWQGLLILKEGKPNIGLNYHKARISAWPKQEGPWHQVVYVWDGSAGITADSLKCKGVMYVDGLEIETHPDFVDPLADAKIIQVGTESVKYVRNANSNYVAEATCKTTAIDEVVIYDYAWSMEEVEQNFEQWMGRLEDGDVF
ncbi:MAG: LamG-like jellyroll fold domain-containing protein [Kiritimatiellia bacterium]|nr:LamG-like jellyroll fold domain-containing protein [Kiritimatiellia bacterium]